MELTELVVDANVVFAGLIKRSFNFELLRLLPRRGIKLYSPAYILDEIGEHVNRLQNFSKLSRTELKFLIELLFRKIEVVPKSKYKEYLEEGKKLLPKHPEDAPYFALALKLNCPLWSNERLLKRQSRVKVFSTKELIKFLSETKRELPAKRSGRTRSSSCC